MTDPPEMPPASPSSRLELRVATDGMSAFAKLSAGEPLGRHDLDAALEAAGIVHGVEQTVCTALVDALVNGTASQAELEIARGTPAGASRRGYFEPAFEPGLQPGHVREDGTLDFHDREMLKPVSIGEALGRVVPPIEGAPGLRVDGMAVAAKAGQVAALRVGPGTELLADGRVVASLAGVVIYVEGRSLEVGTRYEHKGNVDLRTGDLSMEGSLIVRGDVERGFWVRATGDLEIQGTVDGGSAYAGANLKISGGVRGSDGGVVSANGNLRVRHIERARLDSGSVLEVIDAVNSELSAVNIHVEHSVRGGRAAAEVGLVTRDAGTPAATADTVLEAGVPRAEPEADARCMIEAAKAQRMAARRPPGRSGAALDRAKGGKLARELAGVRELKMARTIERAERMAALLPGAFIEVHGHAHPGVDVRIGTARLLLESTLHAVRFTLEPEGETIRTEAATK